LIKNVAYAQLSISRFASQIISTYKHRCNLKGQCQTRAFKTSGAAKSFGLKKLHLRIARNLDRR